MKSGKREERGRDEEEQDLGERNAREKIAREAIMNRNACRKTMFEYKSMYDMVNYYTAERNNTPSIIANS